MRNKKLQDTIRELSKGVFDTLIDSSLFALALWAQSYSVGSGRKDLFQAIENSIIFVKEIRGKYFKSGVYQAARKGYLVKEGDVWKITEGGEVRLQELLPHYKDERQWDGKIRLITYDVPETKKRNRDLLREFLKENGCGMFQASVWLTPYDPKKTLPCFIAEHRLNGMVIVSEVGKDGNVGQIPVEELVGRVYRLQELNNRYKEFLREMVQGKLTPWEIRINFLSILKDDPQLPFDLLPKNWLGEKAYSVFQKNLNDRA